MGIRATSMGVAAFRGKPIDGSISNDFRVAGGYDDWERNAGEQRLLLKSQAS